MCLMLDRTESEGSWKCGGRENQFTDLSVSSGIQEVAAVGGEWQVLPGSGTRFSKCF